MEVEWAVITVLTLAPLFHWSNAACTHKKFKCSIPRTLYQHQSIDKLWVFHATHRVGYVLCKSHCLWCNSSQTLFLMVETMTVVFCCLNSGKHHGRWDEHSLLCSPTRRSHMGLILVISVAICNIRVIGFSRVGVYSGFRTDVEVR